MFESNDKLPIERATRRPSWFRVALLWGVVVGLLIGIYWSKSTAPTRIAVVGIAGGVVVLLLVIVFVSSMLMVRRWRRAQQDINDGVAALSRGQLARANEIFTRWCMPANSIVSAIARHNLAWTLMRQGELQQAIGILSNNDSEHDRELKRVALHATSAVDLALDHALLGNLDEAAQWLEKGEQRAKVASSPSWHAMHVFSRAVLDCRNGRFEDAARLLDERWAECEAELKGTELRPLRVIRAFAHTAAGPRDAGRVDDLLRTTKPMFDGEYDFLGVAWPAMRTFLVTNRLATLPAADSTNNDEVGDTLSLDT